ncbi:MAG TPA: DUF2585 family protein [Pyrinomonadaceae bacterium]|jgi:Protein of unknown function (DUF2585)
MTPSKTDRARLASIIAIAASVLSMALLLWVEGRFVFCSCGVFRVWSGDTCSASNSQQLFDPYSFTHVLHGFFLFWLVALLARRLAPAWQLWLGLTLEAAWEVFENTRFVIDRYRAETAALGYTGDTIVNSLGDLTCALAGFLVAQKLGALRSIIVFLVLELILVLWIHDSLLLQLLMLIHPVEAIKQWQMCR